MTTVCSTEGPKDPMANAMTEMMERIKSGNIQLKPVRSVSPLNPFFFSRTREFESDYPNYDLKDIVKQTVPLERTAEERSFEWSHFSISSTEFKVRATFYSIINITTGKYS